MWSLLSVSRVFILLFAAFSDKRVPSESLFILDDSSSSFNAELTLKSLCDARGFSLCSLELRGAPHDRTPPPFSAASSGASEQVGSEASALPARAHAFALQTATRREIAFRK